MSQGKPWSRTVPVAQLLSADPLVGVGVEPGGGIDDVGGERWWRRFLVPRLGLEPVAQRLLVERRRVGARGTVVGRPKTGRVRGEHLITDRQLPVDGAELEFGVADHHTLLLGPRSEERRVGEEGAQRW